MARIGRSDAVDASAVAARGYQTFVRSQARNPMQPCSQTKIKSRNCRGSAKSGDTTQ